MSYGWVLLPSPIYDRISCLHREISDKIASYQCQSSLKQVPGYSESLDSEEDGSVDSDTHKIEADMTGVKGQAVSNEGLILPRKLHNPCLENQNRKELHRELLLNQKMGKNVLNQKSELQKAMEKHKEQVTKRELEAQRQENMTPFEKVIEQRAKRLEIMERDINEKEISQKEPEFLQIHAKLRARMDAK